MRHRRAGAVAAALGLLLLIAGCSSMESPGESPTEGLAGLAEYQRNCETLNQTLRAARVIYEPSMEMARGESSLVALAVTLDQATPPDKVLRRSGSVEEGGFLASCRLQARLHASPYDFDVDARWEDRSLVTTDTARWSFYATPKIGGSHPLIIQVRPILQLQNLETQSVLNEDLQASISEFEARVNVAVPWTERPQESMARLAKTFQVAETLVKAVTGLVVAVAALLTALGVNKVMKGRKAAGSPDAN